MYSWGTFHKEQNKRFNISLGYHLHNTARLDRQTTLQYLRKTKSCNIPVVVLKFTLKILILAFNQ